MDDSVAGKAACVQVIIMASTISRSSAVVHNKPSICSIVLRLTIIAA